MERNFFCLYAFELFLKWLDLCTKYFADLFWFLFKYLELVPKDLIFFGQILLIDSLGGHGLPNLPQLPPNPLIFLLPLPHHIPKFISELLLNFFESAVFGFYFCQLRSIHVVFRVLEVIVFDDGVFLALEL